MNLKKSLSWRQSLNSLVKRMSVTGGDTHKLAAALHYLSNEHHYSLVELVSRRVYASGFALLRPQFEVYVRAAWAFHCASSDEAKEFLNGNGKTPINFYIEALENTERFKDKLLSSRKLEVWSLMCDFTHGGGIQASWHINRNSIGSAYSSKEVAKLLHYGNSISLVNAVGFCEVCNNNKIVTKICNSHKRIFRKNV